MEALLRWTNDQLGVVPPSEFISVAEETGLILPIGEWVLRNACAQAKAWHDEGLPLIRMSVNVSGQQFALQRVSGPGRRDPEGDRARPVEAGTGNHRDR